jgi:hypothetical protein
MIRELERILWRYKNKKTSDLRDRLENALNNEIRLLVDNKRQSLDSHLSELRFYCPTLLYEFDKMTEQALIQVREYHFEKSLYGVRKAEIALNGMCKILKALDQYESAKNELEQLIDNLGLEALRNLVVLKMLDHFLNKAHEFLKKNSPRKTLFAVRLCQQEIKVFKTRTIDKEEEKRILTKIEVLFQYESIIKTDQFESLTQVKHLVKEGYLNLGEMLTDDINMELLGGQAKFSHLNNMIPVNSTMLENLEKVTKHAKVLNKTIENGFDKKDVPVFQPI